MNGFKVIFGDRIKLFWEEKLSPSAVRLLLNEVLMYANANADTFTQEIAEIQFDRKLQPLPVVLEALASDTDNWGPFFLETMDMVFDRTKHSDRPQEIVDHLIEFVYIEKQQKPFVQQIVARLHQELFSDNITTKCAAISMLPNYLSNPVVDDKTTIIKDIQSKLVNPIWRVRYTAYITLKKMKLLPKGFQLPVVDSILRIYYGRPYTM